MTTDSITPAIILQYPHFGLDKIEQ